MTTTKGEIVNDIPEPKNRNYAAVVVALPEPYVLPGLDRLRGVRIFGNQVLVNVGEAAGTVGLFFPLETELSSEFLGMNNLYRKPEWGNVTTKSGFFEQHGRVRAVKFRGHKSEGFWLPISCLAYVLGTNSLPIGTELDEIDGHKICQKYVPPRQQGTGGNRSGRSCSAQDRIAPNQFAFHYDTQNLRRNAHVISVGDELVITDKWHGTSVVVANLLVTRELSWWERLLVKFGASIERQKYGYVWSSRRVIKGVDGEALSGKKHFYDDDVWGAVMKEVYPLLPPGYTVYGEIVGYTPTGAPIQGGYTYGNLPGGHRFVVYRVTHTAPDGTKLELSWDQIVEFCRQRGLETVKLLARLRVTPGLFCSAERSIGESVIAYLERTYVCDQDCAYNPGLPAEGIVVRIERNDGLEVPAYKLKNFRFLERETKALDQGTMDLETVEAAGE